MGWGAYEASQTTALHMKRLNQTESPIFVILCVLCFQRQSFLTFAYTVALSLSAKIKPERSTRNSAKVNF